MPKNVVRTNGCFEQAIGFLKAYTNMTLPHAMKLAAFSAQEQACCARHMVLHCLWNKGKDNTSNYVTSLPGKVVVALLQEFTSSSVTDESSKEVKVVSKELPMTKIPRICLPIKAAQILRAESLKNSNAQPRCMIASDRSQMRCPSRLLST